MSRIAIVGSGISGLVCAHRLSSAHDVELFEANDYIGGHTATVDVQVQGQSYAIDTGFIVFNDRTYPLFQQLLAELDVDVQATEMSFSVNNSAENLIYNGNTLASLFCQRSNLISPKFWKFVLEILRFNSECKKRFAQDSWSDGITLGQHLIERSHSDFFAKNYILPMASAIWSSSLSDIERMPLKFFIQFFFNHGLLDVSNRPQWYTIKGGSRSYVQALIKRCRAKIHLNTPVRGVSRQPSGVTLRTAAGDIPFDDVIFACHSDQALALLDDPSDAERQVLGAIPYKDNDVILHTDPQLLPPIKAAHASWNYHCDSTPDAPAAVTYSMNILQRLPAGSPQFNVTLNHSSAIREQHILRRLRYSHPVFNEAMVAAQAQRARICGVAQTHFCGAYWYNGFHEDGVRSAEDICARWTKP